MRFSIKTTLVLALLAPAAHASDLPDPPPEQTHAITSYVEGWLDAQLQEDGTYDIPERMGHDVAGTPGPFHTVHQHDAHTFYVCVDFLDGETIYDVDFYIGTDGEDFSVSEHFLHKIDGVVVE
ncbi:MAG: hypothetical protein ACJAYU_001648 [Bradymonadia bacterium]|jgi:hypothetical protein